MAWCRRSIPYEVMPLPTVAHTHCSGHRLPPGVERWDREARDTAQQPAFDDNRVGKWLGGSVARTTRLRGRHGLGEAGRRDAKRHNQR